MEGKKKQAMALERLAQDIEKILNGVDEANEKNKMEKKGKVVPENVVELQKQQATILIRYIMKRCLESESLCEQVLLEHKSWKRCMNYVSGKAEEIAIRKGSIATACIHEDVVFEWAEDYYRLDDKAEVEKELAEEAARKAKAEKDAAERKAKEEKKKAAEERKKAKEAAKKALEEATAESNEEADLPNETEEAEADTDTEETVEDETVNDEETSEEVDLDKAQISIFDLM